MKGNERFIRDIKERITLLCSQLNQCIDSRVSRVMLYLSLHDSLSDNALWKKCSTLYQYCSVGLFGSNRN